MIATPHPPETDEPDIDDSKRAVTRALTLFSSFRYAFMGIRYLLWTQRNAKIHCAIGMIAVILGMVLPINRVEWVVLILTIALVLTMEGVNTAIEAIVDLASPEYHPLAKVAKDVAAGTVLLAAIASVVVGVIIFLPHLFTLLLWWLQR
ncbi:MAG: diacylglycerol kinase family protein [Chloroflexi bacterium AL-W]|nr:diacylglycerol kinase family protein [Chloroflexi bacterium AL-N1]NOK64541.1 diacylglycerol kinase family protein [Chloroflexi bacterium AL-N10]NOK75783.1 diacylglycerol kinase family protein [Chloroflexi bacterium AL-N5]NOK80458.1 diacylglycerol kinase family protein [Chloroflexi bacterium AL-W]NOK86972.1 diacylglycerol kinase family protein [Chloroflexi bacterium AL-N15]